MIAEQAQPRLKRFDDASLRSIGRKADKARECLLSVVNHTASLSSPLARMNAATSRQLAIASAM
jgi:hypothetical protein